MQKGFEFWTTDFKSGIIQILLPFNKSKEEGKNQESIKLYTTPGPKVIKTFFMLKSTELEKIKYRQMRKFLARGLSNVVFIMLIIVKTPTIADILTFISTINFVLSWVEHEKNNLRARPRTPYGKVTQTQENVRYQRAKHFPTWWPKRLQGTVTNTKHNSKKDPQPWGGQ